MMVLYLNELIKHTTLYICANDNLKTTKRRISRMQFISISFCSTISNNFYFYIFSF